jgi:hypothetical protein
MTCRAVLRPTVSLQLESREEAPPPEDEDGGRCGVSS